MSVTVPPRKDPTSPCVAFVFSGGASLGSVQVGMAVALEEAGITPDLIIGTSVGAVNGSWFAMGQRATDLADVWHDLERSDLFPVGVLLGLRAIVGRSGHFVSDSGLRSLLQRHLSFDRLEEAPVPFQVIATDAVSGDEVVLRSGPALDAVLASAALPGIFPPVDVDGRMLFDGGVSNNTPISRAIEAGATEVWVLNPGYSCGLVAAPDNALALALHSTALLVQQRLVLELANKTFDVPVHLIPAPCPLSVTPIDFSQSSELIARATAGTKQWLGNGRPNAMPLVIPHQHQRPHLIET